MKKSLIITSILALGLGLAACNKASQPVAEENSVSTGSIAIFVEPNNGSATTKMAGDATVTALESNIGSLQVFVYYGASDPALGQVAGNKETDKYYTYSGSAVERSEIITTTTGEKRIYVVANAPRIMNANTETELKSRVIGLGSNIFSTDKGMVMVGASGYTSTDAGINVQATNVTVNPYSAQAGAASMTTIPIKLNRLAARIELQNVKVDFRGTDLEGKEMTIKDIYLKNVPNAVHVTGQNADLLSSESNWSNRIRPDGSLAADIKALIFSSLNKADVSEVGADTPINQFFYCYPNNVTTDVTADTWAPRRTRLVLSTVIGDQPSFYPFSIAAPENFISSGSSDPATNTNPSHITIVGNHKYVINRITITSMGKPNDDTDAVIVSGKAQISVSVQDWNGTTILNYDI